MVTELIGGGKHYEIQPILFLNRTNDAEKILGFLRLSCLISRSVKQPGDLSLRTERLLQLFDSNPAGADEIQPPMGMRLHFRFLPFPEGDASGHNHCFVTVRADCDCTNDKEATPKLYSLCQAAVVHLTNLLLSS